MKRRLEQVAGQDATAREVAKRPEKRGSTRRAVSSGRFKERSRRQVGTPLRGFAQRSFDGPDERRTNRQDDERVANRSDHHRPEGFHGRARIFAPGSSGRTPHRQPDISPHKQPDDEDPQRRAYDPEPEQALCPIHAPAPLTRSQPTLNQGPRNVLGTFHGTGRNDDLQPS